MGCLNGKDRRFENPTLKNAFQADGIKSYHRAKSGLYENLEFTSWYYYYTRAELYAQTRETDRAFEFLNKALEARSHRTAQLEVDPKLDNLRSDPRFKELLRIMNLDD